MAKMTMGMAVKKPGKMPAFGKKMAMPAPKAAAPMKAVKAAVKFGKK